MSKLNYNENSSSASGFNNNKNLYMLSDSNKKGYHNHSPFDQDFTLQNNNNNNLDNDQQELSEISDIQEFNQRQTQYDLQKLHQKNQQLLNKIHQLKVKNKQLVDINDLLENRNNKHQEKQRQLIKKLSYEQVSNKQLQYQVQKLAQQLIQIKQNHQNHDQKIWQINQIVSQAQNQRNILINILKKTFDILLQAQNQHDFVANSIRVRQFINKNLKIAQSSNNLTQQFDLKFQLIKISDFKQKASSLEQTIKKLKQQHQNQKHQKKRIIQTYNQKINKLKQNCQMLKRRVQQKQNEHQHQISHLKDIIQQKNQLIQDMKSRFQNIKKDSFYASRKKNKSVKKSYIGDGQYLDYGNFNDYKLNDLQNQIEQLEKKLIKQLKD